MMMRLASVVTCLLALIGLLACGTHTLLFAPEQATTARRAALPTFPPQEPEAAPVPRQTSDNTLALDGADVSEQSPGSASYADPAEPSALALVPGGGDDLAWAIYSFGGITIEKPIRASVELGSAKDTPGGAELPLRCWIGVADYTQAFWEWHGPYTQPGAAEITLNAQADGEIFERRDRYLSAAGSLQLVVLTDAAEVAADAGNPQGLCAVRITSVAVTTSASYQTTKPHFAYIESIGIGSDPKASASVKASSALQPSQFVYLDWTHVAALSPLDLPNVASSYLVFRQGPDDTAPLQIGEVFTPEFTDPLDLLAGAAEPLGGTSYRYFLRARNNAGTTPLAASSLVTIPMLAPGFIDATRDDPGDTLNVEWSAAAGAVSYQLWRAAENDSAQSALLLEVGAAQLSAADATAVPGVEYWYWVKAVGPGDGNPDNGTEAGSVSGFSLGARGVRRVLLSLACTTSGVSGSGSEVDPFILEAGSDYQFVVTDQLGNPRTTDAQWTVDPPAAGTFAPGTPGLLQGLTAGSGGFKVSATLHLAEFAWTASATCQTP